MDTGTGACSALIFPVLSQASAARLWNFLLLKDHQRASRMQFTPGMFDTDPLAAMEPFQTDFRVTIFGEVHKRL